jgi:hypothetical protein
LVLPESISLENLKHIRDEISTRRSTYQKMPATSAAPSDVSPSSSTTRAPNPVVQRKIMVICLMLMLAQSHQVSAFTSQNILVESLAFHLCGKEI